MTQRLIGEALTGPVRAFSIRSHRSGRRSAVLTLVLIAAMVNSALPAAASNFGSERCVSGPPRNCLMLQQSRYVDYFLSNVTVIATSVRVSIDNNVDLTDMVASETAFRDRAEVIVIDDNYGLNGAAGWVDCPSLSETGGVHPNKWCNPQYVYFNYHYAEYYNDDHSKYHIGCHELGHTLGLRDHSSTTRSSCMKDNAPNGGEFFDDHDNDHVNDAY